MSTPGKTSGLGADNSTNPSHEQPAQKKANKKKKSVKKKEKGTTEEHQEKDPSENKPAEENAELSSEEQFQRQLDWCIEQLELGMKLQKATPKQREDAAHALKTLRSSKAPLVKKRQVMRATAGDYRKKMEQEKNKQFKLIKSELTSAQVRVKSASPQKSLFHRRAEVKPMQSEAQKTENATFVFTTSNEEFRFNFV
ncbi:UPF0488 protein C8orf33 homolog [Stigmatopora nigra]